MQRGNSDPGSKVALHETIRLKEDQKLPIYPASHNGVVGEAELSGEGNIAPRRLHQFLKPDLATLDVTMIA
jgi:hypothetical protein